MAEVERWLRYSFDRDNKDLKTCRYIVMGEEKLVGEVTADGYKLNISESEGIITVGEVWRLAETDHFSKFDRNESIRRVCLSFALFKLLRRRFEHLPPMTPEEGRSCHKLMSSLCYGHGEESGPLFLVMADEVKFLSEYYHSVVPVILAGPLFLLVNYFLVPVVVLIICLVAVAFSSSGGLSQALSSMSADNYALQSGFAKLAICALVRAGHSLPTFLFTLDLLITLLLLIIFFFDEIWEFLTVLISNWFIISMVCNYVKKPYWRASAIISGTFRTTLWLRRKMSKYTDIRMKQFSLLSNHSGPRLIAALVPGTLYLNIKSVPMTDYLKLSIGKRLRFFDNIDAVGQFRYDDYLHEDCILSDAYSESTTEVILTLHIATCILEHHLSTSKEAKDSAAAALSLSRYCTYLVVFHPELLPDRRAKAELVLKEAKEELRNLLGFWGYYLSSSSPRARVEKLIYSIRPGRAAPDDGVVHRGIRLARQMMLDTYPRGRHVLWEILADVWTKLLIYASPALASDEEHVRKAHADVLVEGVELITVLWAFAMHTGMERKPPRRRLRRKRLATPSSDEWSP